MATTLIKSFIVFSVVSKLPTAILLLPPWIIKSCPIATLLLEPLIRVFSPPMIVANSVLAEIDEVVDPIISAFITPPSIVFSVPLIEEYAEY